MEELQKLTGRSAAECCMEMEWIQEIGILQSENFKMFQAVSERKRLMWMVEERERRRWVEMQQIARTVKIVVMLDVKRSLPAGGIHRYRLLTIAESIKNLSI